MVTISCLLIGSFLILQTHGTSVRLGEGCNGDPNAETGCDTCGTNCDNYDQGPRVCSYRTCLKDECKCKEGFVKNSKGMCIPYKKCPLVCGKNEVVSRCSGHCQRTCAIRRPKCKRVCTRGCVCRFGYVRDDNTGKCIRRRACQKRVKCRIHEEYKCVKPCPPNTCQARHALHKCAANQKCVNKCECKDNYLRNKRGRCVLARRCDGRKKCKKPNEVPGSRHTCEKTCATLTKLCLPFRNKRLTNKCVCRKGYARNSGGQCIPIRKCPKKRVKCRIHEEYKCVKPCPPNTCQARHALHKCAANQKCVNKCECKDNYLRNKRGRCVLARRCDGSKKCKKPNEVPGSRHTCEKTCRTLTKLCRRFRYKRLTKKCFCRKGYARNSTGQCVPISKCPKKHVKCRVHEEYKCVKPCPPKTCQARFAKFKCVANQKCVNKCECKDNYLRNKRGRCVLARRCDGKKHHRRY